MDDGLSIDIRKFLRTVDLRGNPDFANHLKEALNWLGKRQAYSHHYYRQLRRSTSAKNLEASLLMGDEDARIRFEAANLAYLQNIHAACDAFPFALHVLLGGLSTAQSKSESEHFKWSRKLINEVIKKFPDAVPLHVALSEFATDQNFLMLASLVNQAKHKYFPRLKCNLNMATNRYNLTIESFEYLIYIDGKPISNTHKNLPVVDFAKTIHDETLLKIFSLYKLAYQCVAP